MRAGWGLGIPAGRDWLCQGMALNWQKFILWEWHGDAWQIPTVPPVGNGYAKEGPSHRSRSKTWGTLRKDPTEPDPDATTAPLRARFSIDIHIHARVQIAAFPSWELRILRFRHQVV